MARASMAVNHATAVLNDEILNRPVFEAVPVTLDTTAFTSGVCEKGQVVDKDGKVLASPFAGAIGVLMDDVFEGRPQGVALVKAYVKADKLASGVTASALKSVLPMIVVE